MRHLGESAARSETGALQIVHHATREWGFDVARMAPLSHFGTRSAARARVFDWPETRLISALLDIRASLHLPDINGVHDPMPFARLILSRPDTAARLPEDFLARVSRAEEEAGEGMEEIVGHLRMAGYDGIAYRNHHEDPGSMSWVTFSPDQVHVIRDGLAGESLDPWEHSPDQFLGDVLIQPCFEINGRKGWNDHIWRTLSREGPGLPDLARDQQGWTARWLSDWQPRLGLGLLDQKGALRGFYVDGMLWVDPEARGQGRSALLIEAAADLLGGSPLGRQPGLGISPAGYHAHLSALRQIKARAAENGYIDLEDPAGRDMEVQP